VAVDAGELPSAADFEAAIAQASADRCPLLPVRRKTGTSLCSTVTSGGRPSCTHKRLIALLWAHELLENAAWTRPGVACRRSPAFVGQATAALDSLEPWRSEVAEQLLGGEPVVRQALDAYLRWELCRPAAPQLPEHIQFRHFLRLMSAHLGSFAAQSAG
jgi:hypothetical protein